MRALYRKYRPETFDDVLGQEHVVVPLKSSAEEGNPSHAYLFSGSRGTGKTSLARIFSRAIGCNERDVYEIDAASNRGIDDIRELREAVNMLPFESPYKVYIIDEAHMLTKEAFNALLKTLEEPPSHALFILATTEIHKLPETIISRCETHQFKRPTANILADMVIRVGKKEGYTIKRPAAELIALLGDGSYRDTHGVLQLVLSATQEKIVDQDLVARVTSAPQGALLSDMLSGLDTGESVLVLGALQSAVEQSVDMALLVKLLLNRIRAVLLFRFAPSLAESLKDDMSEGEWEAVTRSAGNSESYIKAELLERFLVASEQIRYSALAHLPLELAVLKGLEKKQDA
jgi:DNA polymerase-3 subunit gamma/tau